jgi:hypothetical protein
MHSRVKQAGLCGVLGLLGLLAAGLQGQSSGKGSAVSYADSPSRWDIFAGYSYLGPHGTVETSAPSLNGGVITPVSYEAINLGAIVSGAYYFNKYVGAQAESSVHEWGGPRNCCTTGQHGNNDGFTFAQVGLIFRFPGDEVTPFVHGLVGGAYVDGPYHNPYTWGPSLTVGGGLDYQTPLLHHKLAIRLFQVDYNYAHANFGPPTQYFGGRANVDSVRASAGIVYHIGSILPPAPITLVCSASPASVYPGDPVTVTGTVGSVYGKLVPEYTWSGTGVTGTGTTVTVSTGSLSGGSYTVNGTVKEGDGKKPWETATCSASFTVKEYEPPTVSCTVTPTTIKPGDSATVTATGLSPQNLSLTYAYTASSGTVTGSGTTATYTSTGAPTGPVTITGTVTDSKGKTATCSTGLTIEAPVVPPAPHVQTLCSITFTKDEKRPTRVDNEAKACLDQVALSLQSQSDAKAVVVGEATSEEKAPKKGKHAKSEAEFAAQRAVDTKEYLVVDKGIDASRISVATGTADSKSVENYLVPAGADFTADVPGTTPVDESVVKPIARTPLAEKKHHKKAM